MKTNSSTRKLVPLLLALAALVAPAPASAAKTVAISGFAFKPSSLTVAKGTRVTFANDDAVAHTATDKGAFDSGRIKAGKSFTVRFGQKGTFAYHCKIHTYMRGKVIVG